MTMIAKSAYAVTLCAALAVAACGFERKSTTPTSPSTPSLNSYLGVWSSSSIAVPSPDSCNTFNWQVTNVNGSTLTGDFSATCAGGLQANGSGTGTLNVDVLNWNATGTATQGSVTCSFVLSGTAKLETASTIKVNYSGQVCGVAVSGTEILHK